MLVNRPIPYQGTQEQAAANYASHSFDEESGRCVYCDSKAWHVAANYYCGVEPPRETVEV